MRQSTNSGVCIYAAHYGTASTAKREMSQCAEAAPSTPYTPVFDAAFLIRSTVQRSLFFAHQMQHARGASISCEVRTLGWVPAVLLARLQRASPARGLPSGRAGMTAHIVRRRGHDVSGEGERRRNDGATKVLPTPRNPRHSGCRLPVAGCRLPVAGCRLVPAKAGIASCLLPIAGNHAVACRLQLPIQHNRCSPPTTR